MALGDWLRRVIGRPADDLTALGLGASGGSPNQGTTDFGATASAHPGSSEAELATAWLAALESGRLNPPVDVHNALGWDTYWRNQIEVGALDQGFSDMMSSDPTLAPLLARRGVRKILCAGNGLSSEALALAMLGFDVTALDISSIPARVFSHLLRSSEHPINRIPGFSVADDNVVRFNGSGPIDSELCPKIHNGPEHPPKNGGSLTFAVGDLMTASVCPGLYDAVIERRTVQLFPEHERSSALERLSARLGSDGVFVSHQHVGAWRPGQPRTHYAESWVKSHGYVPRSHTDASSDGAARLADLRYSTG